MAPIPVYIYRNNNFLNSEYIYNDAYLVIFKEGDHYLAIEANLQMELDKTKTATLDENELTDMVNDTCCGNQVYTLIFNNPKKDPIAYSNFISSI